MTNDKQEGFNELQKLNLAQCSISLCIIKKTQKKVMIKDRYSISYVRTEEEIKDELRSIISKCIQPIKNVEEYAVDCSESVEAQVLSIKSNKTEFPAVLDIIKGLSPEEDVVTSSDSIVDANIYAIVVREKGNIKAVGFRKIPENWGTKIKKGLIFACFSGEKTLEFLDKDSILSIADNIDFIFYGDELFIFSKRHFEDILGYRERIIENAKLFFDENKDSFEGLEDLQKHVGENMTLLRKIEKIRELEIYKDDQYQENIKKLSKKHNWGFKFRSGKMVIDTKNKDSIKALLSVLQNKRLYSEITNEHYDAEYAKLVVKK